IEGYADVAALFRSTAEGETGHAHGHLEYLEQCGDPATGLINSGIQIRTQRNPSGHEVKGYQCDYGEPKWYAGIYDEGRRNKFIAPADMEKIKPAVNLWGWNEYIIRADGKRIQTWINGVQGVDYTELDENIASDGIIAIQLHSGGNAVVQVKDVEIEELPLTPGLPTWASLASAQAQPAAPAPAAAKTMKEGNAPESHPRTPEEERAAFTVPEGFAIELVASEDIDAKIGKFVPITFDAKGRLWTTTCFEYPVDGNENASFADALYNGKGVDKVLVYERDPASPTGYASKPKTIYDGLAIPTGVLPYKDSFYVLHGHDILKFAQPKDGTLATNPQTVLTGFGVEDSHLMPHQFTRSPGGWLWLAQGAFNKSKVRRPEDPQEKSVSFDKTRMGKFRPDGSGFEATTTGPCNIWGLVTTGEGESFIQEANDFGYPVMPFHEYANYPGCCDGLFKSYAPPFPGTAPDFRVGGTGLSGLALTDKGGVYPEAWSDVMLLANPITNKINAVKMHRDGPRWRLEQLPDFVSSSDPWFRPVAITMGPDGCVYIVDWYNLVISHNEVPRKHPD
ncbi:MAG: family 16 glycoside hydrolase, partial [Verrucomicrobiota bacterium]